MVAHSWQLEIKRSVITLFYQKLEGPLNYITTAELQATTKDTYRKKVNYMLGTQGKSYPGCMYEEKSFVPKKIQLYKMLK